jgi:CheY-like chemotaxis protein
MRTLLLADDSITIQRVIALTFAEEAFKVITVSDGQQAIDRMAAQKPDVVLASTTMPNVNGYELATYVRGQPGLTGVPVLLLTGAFDAADEARVEACGASGTLEKPFEPSIVINRVKELLGIKGDAGPSPTAAAGRKVTPAAAPGEVKPKPKLQAAGPPLAQQSAPISKPTPASWDELRQESGLTDARSVEGGGEGFDGLDAAFDSLDEQLRRPQAAAAPAEPQGRRSVDPQSPGRAPSEAGPGTSNPVFEVDEEWFAEGDKTRAQQRAEQNQLAAEMGIHDVELPEAPAAIGAAAPADSLDFDFGLDERVRPTDSGLLSEVHEAYAAFDTPGHAAPAAKPAPPAAVEPKRTAFSAPPSPFAAALGTAPSAPQAAPAAAAIAPAPAAAIAPAPVAAAFVAVPAHEQGEPHGHPPHEPVAPVQAAAPVIVQAPPPEITEAMLDQIAERVAEKLGTRLMLDELRSSVTDAVRDAVRDTVRTAVSETSEKLVRDEISRIKSKL